MSAADEGPELVDELPVIRLVRPLPGFADLTRFALVRVDDAAAAPADGLDDPDCVLFELRSLEVAEVRFLVGVAGAFFADYDVEIDDDTAEELGLTEPDDALVLVILTIGSNGASTTANLLAPVVLNARTRQAAQVILSGTDWPVRAAVV